MPPTSRTERNGGRVADHVQRVDDFTRWRVATRLDDADKLTLQTCMDALRAAQLDVQELTIRFQRKYDLREGDHVHRNGTITRAPEPSA